MHFLRYRVSLPDSDKELTDTQAVDGVILPDHRTADVVQVQGSHDVQAGTTARGFHNMGFLSGGHPAIRQLCSLRRVNTINEQDGFIIPGFQIGGSCIFYHLKSCSYRFVL